MAVHFEYLGEDQMFPAAKKWKVEAIHVTTTRNKRKFTLEELTIAGRSLAYRPLNINHDRSKPLQFPENCTEACHFNKARMAVDAIFHISDPAVNALIETNRINTVSIEQIPTLGETCDQIACEQHGVAFIGMALLESHVPPGDKDATGIVHVESQEAKTEKISDLLVSDEQRICPDCTDFEACHTCKHKTAQGENKIAEQIEKIVKQSPKLKKEQIIGKAIAAAGLAGTVAESWWWYNHTEKKYNWT